MLSVTGIDFCAPMLDGARKRFNALRLTEEARSIRGRGCHVAAVRDASFDGATMGFSLRNVVDIDSVLREVRRVLKPGARFVNLDVSKAPNPLWKWCFDLYFYHVVPLIGTIVGGSKQAYTYLPQSLTHHPNAEALRDNFANAGFTDTGFVRLMGGAIAIHYGTAKRMIEATRDEANFYALIEHFFEKNVFNR